MIEKIQTCIFRNTLAPMALLLFSPTIAMLIWYTCVNLGGSIEQLIHLCYREETIRTLYKIWQPYFFGSATAWRILLIFATVQLAFMKLMPGKPWKGPISPKGNIPLYKANGVASFLATLALFYGGAYQLKLFAPTIVYDNFGALLGALNAFSILFCVFLYLKGRCAPSSSDCSSSGNFVFDYYWGTELYPRILGWDVKMFTNCRFGMMSWPIIILSFAAKQQELYGVSDSMIVAVSLQMIYIFKFFCWETGYLRSLDIMHDRAGFYICWGCLVWLPAIYTSPILYLVNHPNQLGWGFSAALFVSGVLCIFINYQADCQRQSARASHGACKIWGKTIDFTVAAYVTEQGESKESLLLFSGWWGISRHFHYIPEILAAFFWTLPSLFHNFLPFFYVTFLTILLFDRAVRDDKRCSRKYGASWDLYCQKVPYKIIPYVY